MIEVIAKFKTSLASGISASATEFTMVSNGSVDGDGETIPNESYGFVIDEENSSREYVIGTVAGNIVTITARGISFVDGITEKELNKYAHRKGASVKITDHPVIATIVEILNGRVAFGEIPLLPASRSITKAREVVDKEYVDALSAGVVPTLLVSDNGGLTVNIGSGYLSLNGDIVLYPGASNQALTDDATNYIEMLDNAISFNTSGFSDDALPVAVVETTGGDITSITDSRAFVTAVDILANSGIGRGASGIYIDLAASSSLEFDSGLKLASTIEGEKTFDTVPLLPGVDPTEDNEAVRKAYVDNLLSDSVLHASPSDNLIVSDDTEAAGSGAVSIEKEIEVRIGGTIRVKFALEWVYGSNEDGTAQIFIDGVAATPLVSNGSATPNVYSYDLAVKPYQLVQLAVGSTDGASQGAISNFRIYFDAAKTETLTEVK